MAGKVVRMEGTAVESTQPMVLVPCRRRRACRLLLLLLLPLAGAASAGRQGSEVPTAPLRAVPHPAGPGRV